MQGQTAAVTASHAAAAPGASDEFVTFTVADQMFGIPVLKVQDILVTDGVAPIPLAPPEVRGSINLRGRIVTAIDVRSRLGLAAPAGHDPGMGVTVGHQNELYALLVDSVGDVISLGHEQLEPNPATLDPAWRTIASGVYRLEKGLMVVLDVDQVIQLT